MDAANALVSGRQSHPTPAVYLSHVALECALKRRILIINRAAHVNDLKRLVAQEDFDRLFSGTTGHNLHSLERTAALRRYLTASGNESLLAHRAWRNMGRERPYSLWGNRDVGDRDVGSNTTLKKWNINRGGRAE